MEVPLRRLYLQHHNSVFFLHHFHPCHLSIVPWLSIKIVAWVLSAACQTLGTAIPAYFWHLLGLVGNPPEQPCLLVILPGPILDFSLHISNIYWVLWEIQRGPVYWQFYQALYSILLCTFLTYIGSCGRSNAALFIGSSQDPAVCPGKRIGRFIPNHSLYSFYVFCLARPQPSRAKTFQSFIIIFRWVNSAVCLSAPGIIFSVIFSLPNYFMVLFLSLG